MSDNKILKLSDRQYYLVILIILFVLRICILEFSNVNFFQVSGDAEEYLFVADNIAKNNGFVSNENNIVNKRAYLGDNYAYAAEPLYPLYLSFYKIFGFSENNIIIIANYILMSLLIYICLEYSKNLGFSRKYQIILSLLLIFNPHIQYFSMILLPEVFRAAIFVFLFLIIQRFVLTKATYFKQSRIAFLGFCGGLIILSRISFLFIPFIILPIFFTKKRSYKNIVIYLTFLFLTTFPWCYRNYVQFDSFTPDPRLSNKISKKGITEIPLDINPSKYELVSSLFRMEDYQKWKNLHDEHDPKVIQNIIDNSGYDNSYLNWSKVYVLRLFNLFKPFPTGSKFATIYFKIYSTFFYIPWVLGLILFLTKRVTILKVGNSYLIASIISFILIHLLQNSPHSRYMITLIPIGYISIISFFSKKYNL